MVTHAMARRALLLLSLVLGRAWIAGGVEQEAQGVKVTASKYDVRSGTIADDNSGCFTDGCEPGLMIDGALNDVPQSRWSCEAGPEGTDCFATFDLGSSQNLVKISMWFYESDDIDRDARNFVVSTSDDGLHFVRSFDGSNTPGTPLGEAEDFLFPPGSSGRYVRITGVLEPEVWLSINEATIFVDAATPAPVPETAAPIVSTPNPTAAASPNSTTARGLQTQAPTVTVTADVTAPPTAPPSLAPVAATASPILIAGRACMGVTVSQAGELSGNYTWSEPASRFVSTGPTAAAIVTSTVKAECGNSPSSAGGDCEVTWWRILPGSSASGLPTFVAYDDATHPSDIKQVWLRLDSCTAAGCVSSPADVLILCSDGSTAGLAPTPAPAPARGAAASDCGTIEVSGTKGGESDGLYYVDDGAPLVDDVTQYFGYDVQGGELTSNGGKVVAYRLDNTCSSTSATLNSAGAAACSFRQWWIEPSSSAAFDYYTYDEATHPADIAPHVLWYTSKETVAPYAGEVSITCAPAAAPQLPSPDTATPAPTARDRGVPRDDDPTRAPVGSSAPAVDGTLFEGDGDGGGGGGDNIAVIGGAVGGSVALVAVVALAVHMLKRPPPPSYNDLVGS